MANSSNLKLDQKHFANEHFSHLYFISQFAAATKRLIKRVFSRHTPGAQTRVFLPNKTLHPHFRTTQNHVHSPLSRESKASVLWPQIQHIPDQINKPVNGYLAVRGNKHLQVMCGNKWEYFQISKSSKRGEQDRMIGHQVSGEAQEQNSQHTKETRRMYKHECGRHRSGLQVLET